MVTELVVGDFQLRGPSYPGCRRREGVDLCIEVTARDNLDRQQFLYLSREDAADLHERLGELLARLHEEVKP